ncbi:hypothetical protein QUG63_29235, partial [Klebsiella michiganensis]|uniref:hypothetical protein n=1 Tax=Klebsiella michiganensis TaxID=1134687 RepID=UPI0025A2A2C3
MSLMNRSRGQLATAYAPGSVFALEGGKGAAKSVPGSDCPTSTTSPLTQRLIVEQIEETVRAWVGRALNGAASVGRDIPMDLLLESTLITSSKQPQVPIGAFV